MSTRSAVPDTAPERSADPGAPRRGIRTVRSAARRGVEGPAETRDGLRHARADGGKRLHHVATRRGTAGSRRPSPPHLRADGLRPARAERLRTRRAPPDAGARAMTRPGARLRSWASRLLDPSTMERLIDPAIADLQHEHEEAVRRGLIWRGRVILPHRLRHVLEGADHRHRQTRGVRAVGRGRSRGGPRDRLLARRRARADCGPGAASAAVDGLTTFGRRHRVTAACLYSVPSALVVAVPLGLVFGLLLGLRNRVSTPRVTWTRRGVGDTSARPRRSSSSGG